MLAAGLLIGAVLPSNGADTVQITAQKKTGSKYQSGQQVAPGGASSRLVSKEVYVEFCLRSMSPKNPEVAQAEWALMVEGMGGRPFVAAKGREEVKLTFGQVTKLETESVQIDERQLNLPRRGSSKIKEDLRGHAIRLLGPQGEVLAEKYTPSSVKEEFETLFARQEEGREKTREFLKKAFDKNKEPPPFRPKRIPKRLRP